MDKRTKEYKTMAIEKVVYTCLCCGKSFVGELGKKPDICPICKNPSDIAINTSLIVSKQEKHYGISNTK